MKSTLLALIMLSACTTRVERYVAAIDSKATCIRWGADGALCRHDLQMVFCSIEGDTTVCRPFADLRPKATPAPAPTPSQP